MYGFQDYQEQIMKPLRVKLTKEELNKIYCGLLNIYPKKEAKTRH